MALDMSYKGKEIAVFDFRVESAKIRELCLAIGDDNPLFFDSEAARALGYDDTPAPLTFASLMTFWGYPKVWEGLTSIGIDIQRLLHAKEEYEYIEPIYPGDTIKASVVVDSLRDGALKMAAVKTTFSRGGKPVLVAKMTVMVPPAKVATEGGAA